MTVTLIYHEQPLAPPPPPRPLLITGAGGRVGSHLTRRLADRGEYRLRLMIERAKQRERVEGFEDVVKADLRDPLGLRSALEGIHTVIHLAANPSTHARWHDLTGPNLDGLYNLFAAAADAGCEKVVYASSVNAVTGSCREDRPIDEEDPIAPGNLYGATKALGEGVGRVFAQRPGLSVHCLRLGGVMSEEHARRDGLSNPSFSRTPLAYPDACELFRLCVEDRGVKFGVFQALSEVERPLMSSERARRVLGYRPRYRLTDDGFAEVADAADPAGAARDDAPAPA